MAGMGAMGAAGGGAEERPGRELTLKECVGLALENNLDLRIEKITREMAGREGRAARGGYDPKVSVSAKRSREETAG